MQMSVTDSPLCPSLRRCIGVFRIEWRATVVGSEVFICLVCVMTGKLLFVFVACATTGGVRSLSSRRLSIGETEKRVISRQKIQYSGTAAPLARGMLCIVAQHALMRLQFANGGNRPTVCTYRKPKLIRTLLAITTIYA